MNWSNFWKMIEELLKSSKGGGIPIPAPDPKPMPNHPPVPVPQPDPPPAPAPPPADEYSKDFAHMNPCSWKNDGAPGCNGMTLVTCPDIPKYDSVVFMADDGRVIDMHFHSMDRGRQQWTNYKWQGKAETRVAGYFLAKLGGKSWKFRMVNPGKTFAENTGKCYRQYR